MAFYVFPSERNRKSFCDFQNLVHHIVFGASSYPSESSLGGDARPASIDGTLVICGDAQPGCRARESGNYYIVKLVVVKERF
jgi:hypothetical protein